MRAPVVGIVGGGQLARMTAQAAISLDVETRVLASDPLDPAFLASSRAELGDPADLRTLERFAARCDVLTFDHERVEPALVRRLEEAGHAVRPHATTLGFADKSMQRRSLCAAGLPVPPFEIVDDLEGLLAAGRRHGWPLVAKTATGGYDGRGVFELSGPSDAKGLVTTGGAPPLVVEPRLDLVRELSVLVARRPGGETVTYQVVETRQHDGVCVETVAPAPVDEATAALATALAASVAVHADAVGLLAVELFETREGLFVNELAPRPHNSGHWTIEGAITSQFENHLRAILDWPLGDPSMTAGAVVMVNVLGGADPAVDARGNLPAALGVAGVHVHLYGKEGRPGRKLGHVTARGDDPATAAVRARTAAALLTGDDRARCSDTEVSA